MLSSQPRPERKTSLLFGDQIIFLSPFLDSIMENLSKNLRQALDQCYVTIIIWVRGVTLLVEHTHDHAGPVTGCGAGFQNFLVQCESIKEPVIREFFRTFIQDAIRACRFVLRNFRETFNEFFQGNHVIECKYFGIWKTKRDGGSSGVDAVEEFLPFAERDDGKMRREAPGRPDDFPKFCWITDVVKFLSDLSDVLGFFKFYQRVEIAF